MLEFQVNQGLPAGLGDLTAGWCGGSWGTQFLGLQEVRELQQAQSCCCGQLRGVPSTDRDPVDHPPAAPKGARMGAGLWCHVASLAPSWLLQSAKQRQASRMKPGQCLPCPGLLRHAGGNLGTPKGLGHPVPTHLVALVQAPHGLERQRLGASSANLPLLL